jgi:TRAP-type C4-dicarboxylate transport system permease small subunit
MKKLYKGVVRCEQYLSRILFAAIVLLTFGAAMSRVFGFSLPWSMDLTLLLFGWFAFLAASQATRRKAHLGVDLITSRLPIKTQYIIDLINKVIMAAFLIFLAWHGFSLSITNSERMLTALSISYSFVTLSLSVGCLLMVVSLIIQVVQRILVLSGRSQEADFNRL